MHAMSRVLGEEIGVHLLVYDFMICAVRSSPIHSVGRRVAIWCRAGWSRRKVCHERFQTRVSVWHDRGARRGRRRGRGVVARCANGAAKGDEVLGPDFWAQQFDRPEGGTQNFHEETE